MKVTDRKAESSS